MARKIHSKTGDAESKRPTEVPVDGQADPVAAPPAEPERPLLRFLWIATMILFGLSTYTTVLITTLLCTISDPCTRIEVGRFLMQVSRVMSALTAMLLFFYLMFMVKPLPPTRPE